MEKLKSWIMDHKALAAGGAIAIGLILYLWLSSRGGAPAQAGDGGALAAFYQAQAAAQGADSATQQSTNALAAATNQVQAAKDVELAKIQGQLTLQTQQMNQVAYQDWLHENSQTGPLSSIAPGTNANWIEGTNAYGAKFLWSGDKSSAVALVDPATGARFTQGELPGLVSSGIIAPDWLQNSRPVYWSGLTGSQPTAPTVTPPKAAWVAPFTVPTLH